MFNENNDENNDEMRKDLIKKRADRISKLFPPCTLAYSFLLKSNNFKLSLNELFDQIMQFPQASDSRKIFLSPDDTKLFDFQDIDLFQISLNKFIDFTPTELLSVLNNCYFNILPNEVCISQPPEVNIPHTLLVFRHLYPDKTENEIYNEISKPRFIAYFHYHKLNLDPNVTPIPKLQPPESFFYFNQDPSPEQALLSIFCAKRTDQIQLNEILRIKRYTPIYIGPDKNEKSMNTAIDDLFELVQKSHIFHFVDDTIQVYPPLILSHYFDYEARFVYRPNENPCLIHPFDDENQIENEELSFASSQTSNALFSDVERLLDRIGKVTNFTFSQIFQHVVSQQIGCDQYIFGESEVSINDIKNAISKWIDKHAESDLISKIQGSENNNQELIEERKISLLSSQKDRINGYLIEQLSEEYSLLKPDSLEFETADDEIRREDKTLYKLK
ncbi:hypothetical protein M9Y10_038419 [Tritrichomonas musculus]|uniref:Uncharacterized protein n=1 Tax=Tritrichomonas musculus TaxID=1915356 RepID=A0ABR2K8J2_9EUKA